MTENTKQQMINDILNEFDFGKVRRVMEYLDWKWVIDGKRAIPSHNQMIYTAKQLLKDVTKFNDNETHMAACGGFEATAHYDSALSLSFYVEGMETFIEDYEENSPPIHHE